MGVSSLSRYMDGATILLWTNKHNTLNYVGFAYFLRQQENTTLQKGYLRRYEIVIAYKIAIVQSKI